MGLQEPELNTAIPDLRELPLDRLADLGVGDSVLAHSLALYRQRLAETVLPLSSFSARL